MYQPPLQEVFHFLGSVDGTQTSLRVRRRFKQDALVGWQLMRRTKKGLSVVPSEAMRNQIPVVFHKNA